MPDLILGIFVLVWCYAGIWFSVASEKEYIRSCLEITKQDEQETAMTEEELKIEYKNRD